MGGVITLTISTQFNLCKFQILKGGTMKKVLVMAVAVMLISGAAYAGDFAVQGGWLAGTGLGGGIKMGIVEVSVGIPWYGGFPIGGGVVFDVYSFNIDKIKTNVYVGGDFTYFLGAIVPIWTVIGKGGLEFCITDQMSVFGGGGFGVLSTPGITIAGFGTFGGGIIPTGAGEVGVRYYMN